MSTILLNALSFYIIHFACNWIQRELIETQKLDLLIDQFDIYTKYYLCDLNLLTENLSSHHYEGL